MRLEKLEYRWVLSGLPYLATDRPDDTTAEAATVQQTVEDVVSPDGAESSIMRETSVPSVCYPIPSTSLDRPDGEFTGVQTPVEPQAVDQFFTGVADDGDSAAATAIQPVVCAAVYDAPDGQDVTNSLTVEQQSEVVPVSTQATDVFGPIQTVPVREAQATEAEGEPGFGGKDRPPLVTPQIQGFVADSDGVYWSFHGTVVDDVSPEGLVVRFGGILDGETATVDAGGQFELLIELPPGATGNATAQTTDADGLDSNVASTLVS